MHITPSERRKIKTLLSKNYRVEIAEKCKEMGKEVSVRQVSAVFGDETNNVELISAVTNAITQLKKEKRKAKMKLKAAI